MKAIANTYTIEITGKEMNYILVSLHERVAKLKKYKDEGSNIDEFKLEETEKLLDELLDLATE